MQENLQSDLQMVDSLYLCFVVTKRDDLIIIHLEENPTTGYQWEADKIDDKILKIQSSDFNLPKISQVRGSGMRTFKLKAQATGTGDFQVKYFCKWEGEGSVIKRFKVIIMVRD